MVWNKTTRRSRLRYIAAVLIVTIAAAVRAELLGALGTRVVFLTFYPAVMIAALYGGFAAGLLATALSCLTILFLWPLFVDQPFIQDHADRLGMAVFFINCLVISGISEAMHRANARAKLARDQAENANVRLAEASRAKSDFLANMSHELRTPLNSISGFSEILQDEMFGKLNEKQREYVNNIYDSGKHLLSLINDILDLAKVEAGKMELELSGFLLKDELNASIMMMKEKAIKHRIKLDCEIAPDADIEIEADERKFKQIMYNLLSNAVKFTPDGGSVRVSARRIEVEKIRSYEDQIKTDDKKKSLTSQPLNFPTSDTELIEISVADTGIGIKPDDMCRIFKPFTQLESAYTKNYEGTGLGLALTKRLIELHGGSIWVESKFAKGSTFCFAIPINQGSVDRRQQP